MSFMGNILAFVQYWLRNEMPLWSIRLKGNFYDIYILLFCPPLLLSLKAFCFKIQLPGNTTQQSF